MFFEDIETERLLLRNISSDDREFILMQFSDDNVNEYLFDAEPLSTLEEADELIGFYTQPEPRGQHRWIIIEKASGCKIGTCGIHCWNKNEKQVDIGYDLQRSFWGNGIMTEALKPVLDFCLQKMGVCAIDAHISVDNKRSIHLAEKLGFEFDGRTEICSFRGKDYLHNIYTLKADGKR